VALKIEKLSTQHQGKSDFEDLKGDIG